MLVTPRPGVDREQLLLTLDDLREYLIILRGEGGSGDAYLHLLAYLEWTNHAVRMLTNRIRADDIKALVLTRRYELLLARVGNMRNSGLGVLPSAVPSLVSARPERTDYDFDAAIRSVHNATRMCELILAEADSSETAVQRVVTILVSTELDERADAFDAAIKDLKEQITRWATPGMLVLPDSSFYIRHPQKLEDADIPNAAKADGRPIHLVIPIAVIDELDRLKESKDNNTRWRAGYTLAVIDRLFQNTTKAAQLRAAVAAETKPGYPSRGAITIDLLFDPPAHTRLPNMDDEIIDRATTVEAIADRKVTLLTYDTGQSTRARAAGLNAIKLAKPIGEEPNPSSNMRRARTQR